MLNKLRRLTSRPGFYIMRALGRSEFVRQVVSKLAKHTPRPPMATRSETLFTAVDPDTAARNLRNDGISLGVNLPPESTDAIHRYAMTNLCYGNYNPQFGFFRPNLRNAEAAAGIRFATASYFNTAQCPTIKELSTDPTLWAIAQSYLGTVPQYLGTSMWWSFPGERTTNEQNHFAQQFHFDLDDYKFLKFFFYINDVAANAGPHVFVRGSHKRKQLNWRIKLRRHSDEEIHMFYGEENILILTGHAGTGFAEDTYGIHKGTSPTTTPRLILQLQFGLFDYGVQHDNFDSRLLRQVA